LESKQGDWNESMKYALVVRFAKKKRIKPDLQEKMKNKVLWDFAWWATHYNLRKLLVAAKVEAQALKQVYPVEYPIAPHKKYPDLMIQTLQEITILSPDKVIRDQVHFLVQSIHKLIKTLD
jgi:hypothetical protein